MQSFTPEVQKRFKYWQMRTLIATMIGYALFYFVRKNFSLAMPGLEADLGISKTSLGIFLTLNGLVYGLSRFVNGILADRLNADRSYPSALYCAGGLPPGFLCQRTIKALSACKNTSFPICFYGTTNSP
mgnify:CR=1 FL=1